MVKEMKGVKVRFSLVLLIIAGLLVGCGRSPRPVVMNRDTLELKAEESTPAQVSGARPLTQPEEPKTPALAETKVPALPKLWDFWATWCPPCRKQKPIVEELAAEFKGRIEILSIDVDENKSLASRFGVQAIPTLVFLDAAEKELARHVGFWPRDSILAKFRELGFIK